MPRTILALLLLFLSDTTFSQQQKLGAATTERTSAFRGQMGRRVTFVCPAAVPLTAALWGTDVYTDDSPVCTAAVHAGALKPGAPGAVTVVVGGAVATFKGTTRNGVTSREYRGHPGSYIFESGEPPGQVDWNTTGQGLPVDVDMSVIVLCPPQGVLAARLWGTDIYTYDSAICVAAVHAGVLSAAAGGRVAVIGAPGQAAYKPSVRNGVTALTYGALGSSFRVAAAPAAAAFIGPAAALRSATAILPPALGTAASGPTAAGSGTGCGDEFANFCAAAINPASIKLSWAAREEATHYRVLRGGQMLADVAAPAREYIDESLMPGQTAEYKLEALRAAGTVNLGTGQSQPPRSLNEDGIATVAEDNDTLRTTRFASLQTTPSRSATTPVLAAPSGVTAQSVGGPKGRVRVAWSPVPGANGYLVYRDGNPLPVDAAAASNHSSYDNGAPLGRRKYQVEALFTTPTSRRTVNGQASADAFAEVVFPQPSIAFLSRPAGTGDVEQTIAHYRTLQRPDCGGEGPSGPITVNINNCIQLLQILGRSSNIGENWANDVTRCRNCQPSFDGGASTRTYDPTIRPNWIIATFADINALGRGRRVNCAPRRITGGPILCWATSHGSVPAPGAPVDGPARARAGEQVLDISSVSVILAWPDGRKFFGSWAVDGTVSNTLPFDNEFRFLRIARIRFAAKFDSQSNKSVPHVCTSCHGGRYDPQSNLVTGASLLPLVPATLEFVSPSALASQEEAIRQINEIVLSSNPAPAVVAQIDALYSGTPRVAQTRANNMGVPTGWRSEPNIYRQVIEPYCASCHFSMQGTLSLGSVADARSQRDAIQQTTCSTYTMPHSEMQFRRFWTEGGNVSLPGLLSTWLGFNTCGP